MKKTHIYRLLSLMFLSMLVLGACQSSPAEEGPASAADNTTDGSTSSVTPSVTVSDQAISGDSVVIAEVISEGPGWLVIHAQADGKPGPILGYSAVAAGANENVSVQIETAKATETLYAMLHMDAGEAGVFEFPEGPDGPVTVDGKVVTPPFSVSGLAAAEASISLAQNADLGMIMVDAEGFTLYLFLRDEQGGPSTCYGDCEANWPPVLASDGEVTLGEGLDAALLGTTTRDDGSIQVTYNGWPLYYYANDLAPGEINGQGVFDVWYAVTPQGEAASAGATATATEDYNY